MRFLKNKKLSYHMTLQIPPLVNPEKNMSPKDAFTAMFIAALFTVARAWKQPKCSSIDEYIKKMWHIQWNITPP